MYLECQRSKCPSKGVSARTLVIPWFGRWRTWYGTCNYNPEGTWGQQASQIIELFAQSGHPVFRGMCVQPRNIEAQIRKTPFASQRTKHWVNNAHHSLSKSAQCLRAVSSWCVDLSERSGIYNMSISEENEQLSQQLDPQEVGSLVRNQPKTQGAAGNCWREHLQRFEMMTPAEQLHTVSEGAGFIRTVSEGMKCTEELVRTWMMNLGILLYHAERLTPDSEAQQWIYKYTKIGPVLDVKIICHHDVYGIEIQIASTSGDNIKVWVISRSSNRHVDELRYRESENHPEEVAQECISQGERSDDRIFIHRKRRRGPNRQWIQLWW